MNTSALVGAPALLSDRQGSVLRAVVSCFVGDAAPVASDTVASLLARAPLPAERP